MKVPRGTKPLRSRTRGNVTDFFALRPAYLAAWQRDALAAGVMSAVRWEVEATNSAVSAGTFDGLNLESGRARRGVHLGPHLVELRARCRFDSGAVRVVTVAPTIREGDVFWVRGGDNHGARANSKYTLEVVGVDVARLQDMTDADALALGVALLPNKLKENGTPRVWFQRSRPLAWQANPWVWIVRFKAYAENVDSMLAAWESRG